MQRGSDMTNEEALGKYKRLREELAAGYAEPSWDAAHIDRITQELAAVERLLASRGRSPDVGLHQIAEE